MDRYDVKLDMSKENSASLILKMVEDNSKVFEIGAANGRMTKYLKEEKKCEVFISEIEKNPYDDAIKYAYDGFFGNIESKEWEEKLSPGLFDYIIIADVLEHLREPEQLLQRLSIYLKPEGELLISVPNVAHSAILINLLNNQFPYKEEGLLDKTHIHFFTYYTLKEALQNNGFETLDESATYLDPMNTEFGPEIQLMPKKLQSELSTKEFGSVYQFVFRAIKTDNFLKNKDKYTFKKNIKQRVLSTTVKLYFSFLNELDESRIMKVHTYNGTNILNLDISGFDNPEFVRVSFEDRPSLLIMNDILLDDNNYNISDITGNYLFKEGNAFFFLEEAPQLYIKLNDNKKITLKFEYIPIYGEKNILSSISAYLKGTRNLLEDLKKENLFIKDENIKNQIAEIKKANEIIKSEEQKNERLNKKLSEIIKSEEQKNEKLNKIEQRHKHERIIIDKQLLRMKNDISNKVITVNQLQKRNSGLKEEIEELEQLVNSVYNSTSWKLTKPARFFIELFRKSSSKDKDNVKDDNHFYYEETELVLDNVDGGSNPIYLSGWAYSKDQIERLDLKIRCKDEEEIVPIDFPIRRDDVAAAYGNEYRMTGFNQEVFLDTEAEYSLELVIKTENKSIVRSLGTFSNNKTTK